MSTTLTGKIERVDIGTGTWALVTDSGETYELQDPPEELCQAGLKVRITGQVQEDAMTLAAIGPVLAVESFSAID